MEIEKSSWTSQSRFGSKGSQSPLCGQMYRISFCSYHSYSNIWLGCRIPPYRHQMIDDNSHAWASKSGTKVYRINITSIMTPGSWERPALSWLHAGVRGARTRYSVSVTLWAGWIQFKLVSTGIPTMPARDWWESSVTHRSNGITCCAYFEIYHPDTGCGCTILGHYQGSTTTKLGWMPCHVDG